jgi:hypothetical protein
VALIPIADPAQAGAPEERTEAGSAPSHLYRSDVGPGGSATPPQPWDAFS